MATNEVNDLNIEDELNKVNLSIYGESIELWRTKKKCRVKLKSIEELENSTKIANIENKWLEKLIDDTKSRIIEVRDNIVSFDKITMSLYETLTHLEVQCNKKEFSNNKSRNEYELKLFIKMELWQKEEERLNNIPEVQNLKIADSELTNTKLEYEKLLLEQENLALKINEVKKENDKKLNDAIIRFANVYIEMISLNKKEEHCKFLLKKIDADYYEKLSMKNSLLESQRKNIHKVPYWTHALCPFNSKIIDLNIEPLAQDLKPDFNFSSSNQKISDQQKIQFESSKLNNKLKKNVTFQLSPEKNVTNQDDNIPIVYKKINTHLENSIISINNININYSSLKNTSNTNKISNSISENSTNYECSNKDINDFQVCERKRNEEQSDFEFKKPYDPVENYFQENQNNFTSKKDQPSVTNENVQKENISDRSQEKVESLIFQINNDPKRDDNIQNNSLLKLTEQQNSINSDSENTKVFNDIFQSIGFSSQEQNQLSGMFWNDCGDQTCNSGNSSFCGSDFSEILACSYDSKHCSDIQSSLKNSFYNNSNLTDELAPNFDTRELPLNNPQQSGNSMFQPFKNVLMKKTKTEASHSYISGSTSKDFTKPIKPHFVSSEQFRFNFN